MTSFVISPLRDSTLEEPATGSAIGLDLIGRGLALSVKDLENSMFYSSYFSSARGTASATKLVVWFAFPALMFLLSRCFVVENVAAFF